MDGGHIPIECARRLREEEVLQSQRQDSYVLAYQYREYMEKHPMRHQPDDRQYLNNYYENLLANQPEPDPDATDDESRAIRYAKEHFECFYEVRDVKRIVEWLDEAEDRLATVDMTSLFNSVADWWARVGARHEGAYEVEDRLAMTLLIDHIGSPSQEPHETSSP